MRIRNKALAMLGAAAAMTGAANAMPTMDYVKAAGASDMFEKQSAAVVLSSTKNAGIRKYAQMMVTDHSKSTNMVKSAAMHSGLSPKPPMLMPKQAMMLRDLKAAKGPARDTLYISQQKMAHQEALATQQDYAATGDKPALKKAAADIVPVVKGHIGMLEGMPAM